ncbi:MAG: LL-diaminopimelate aminotransferase [Deltaproteobacteria bacterium RBG_13_43_22]|nr:MAG: LL-diaminopimelate aminotransferase [Deltaproteobacteria bacterium RBG_13_43_22]
MDWIQPADRLKQLPPYLFMEIDRLKVEVQAKGVDIIDLGVGDPDLPTPAHILNRLNQAALDPKNHRYPSYSGMNDFRKVVASWYQRRFNVTLDPEKEVVTLIGSKEGIAHFPLAFLNPGDLALVSSPGYPVYHIGTLFAGGQSYFLPLLKENRFLPDLSQIPKEVAGRGKILFLNYPNNPTAAVADRVFFEQVVRFARENQVIVAHDAAYSEIAYDGIRPMSFLEIPGAKEVGIEFHSLSKTYNMTGWRIGFAVGNPLLIAGLSRIKSNIDSGAAQAIQWAGIDALEGPQDCLTELNAIYQKRRDLMVAGLKKIGLRLEAPKATFYLWVEVPKGYTSTRTTAHLLEQTGIVTTPGNGFGDPGEGYFRISLTVPEDRLEEAVVRLSKAGF